MPASRLINGPGWLAITTLALCVLFAVSLGDQYLSRVRQTPPGLGAWRMQYGAALQRDGFVPNGVFVFALPKETADETGRGGVAYLRRIAPGRDWRATPVGDARPWTLATFLDAHEVGVDVDLDIADELDRAMNAPGAFYVEDSEGLLVVLPAAGKVAYAYN